MSIIRQMKGQMIVWGISAAAFGLMAVPAIANGPTGPSVFCHVSDGMFTTCPNNGKEWSDIASTSFFDASSRLLAVLYVDQGDADPNRSIPGGSGIDTLFLMYDEIQRTAPLLPGETVHVHFMTVDNLQLLHYDVFIGPNGLERVLINGVEQKPMPTGLKGTTGYGSSPNNSSFHVMAELQIGLEAAGFTSEECCYSSDPAWWGSDVPPNPECPREDQQQLRLQTNNQGDGCTLQKPESTTAGVFTTNPNGSTTVESKPLLPPGQEPSLCESIGRIVDFRVPPTGIYRNHGDYVKKVAQLTEALVNSQVAAGLITKEEAEKLQSCVVNPRARSGVGKK